LKQASIVGIGVSFEHLYSRTVQSGAKKQLDGVVERLLRKDLALSSRVISHIVLKRALMAIATSQWQVGEPRQGCKPIRSNLAIGSVPQ
jgi:hypothetical protein